MAIATNLGFPRIGPRRELKKALESFWAGESNQDALVSELCRIRNENWRLQKELGIQHIPVNDSSLYDHVLDTCAMVGAIPSRFGFADDRIDVDTYFAMARGVSPRPDGDSRGSRTEVVAMEMTKWFDTNYHYIVPEFESGMKFRLTSHKPLSEFRSAKQLGIVGRTVLLGPVTFLLLGKAKDPSIDRLALLPGLLPLYEEILSTLSAEGAEWIQLDEPCLVLDIDDEIRTALSSAYARLVKAAPKLKVLVATYFEGLRDNLSAALSLPVAGLHLDLVRAPTQLDQVLNSNLLHSGMSLSLGVVDGRNIWKTDLERALGLVERTVETIGTNRVMVGPSCSLLHCPIDLDLEAKLEAEIKNWMAFAKQKLQTIATLAKAANGGRGSVQEALSENAAAMESRRSSARIHSNEVKSRVGKVTEEQRRRAKPYAERRTIQTRQLRLPKLPTTTIGSFPQTPELRALRANLKAGKITPAQYEGLIKAEIQKAVRFQEEIGLDVLVHGEFERNDMVEYFGEQLSGFCFTQNGWVQSYGSRYVKPPVVFGDVSRPKPITVGWSAYAQSLTATPIKGMLTGPVTILQWSFVRDDQPRSETCKQIALAIRDEVADLEAAGIRVIQIDEPAFREGLPLRRADWEAYLRWAVDSFRLAASGVRDATQVHTHMCYSEFNDFMDSIAAMDADVISIESSRSQMELLGAFRRFKYPNEIGPGVYDIHSPRVPRREEIEQLLRKALEVLSPDQLWVNPDCGLKTRRWLEVKPSLIAMVQAARNLRSELQNATRAGRSNRTGLRQL